MEVKIESKIGALNQPEEYVYGFIADCNNFAAAARHESVKEWSANTDSCSFSVEKLGQLTFRILERQPFKLVKFAIETTQAENVILWVQMKANSNGGSHIKLTTKMEVNAVLKMFISKPLKAALDKIVDTLSNNFKQ